MYFERVKNLREDHDFTQDYVSKFLKINRVVYNRYENGLRTFPIHILIQLADLYNVSLDYLTKRTDEKSIKRNTKKRVKA